MILRSATNAVDIDEGGKVLTTESAASWEYSVNEFESSAVSEVHFSIRNTLTGRILSITVI
jgi:hypothetical protein